MRVLVIPDVHLKPYIFLRAKELLREGVADTAVCLMDIPDDWGKQFLVEAYVGTFDEAIAFAKEFPDARWCYGNHELSYVWEMLETGYSPTARYSVLRKLDELRGCLPESNSIRYIQRIDNVLFCHGGLCQYFVDKHVPHSKQRDIDFVLDTINALERDALWCDDSPIWHRPQYSRAAAFKPRKYLQVVGHTPMEQVTRVGNVISCDVFSTRQDGRPIGTQEFLVIDTQTWEFRTLK